MRFEFARMLTRASTWALVKKQMNPKISIRSESYDDIDAIAEVTTITFQSLEISGHTEQFIIEALRAARNQHVML